MPHRPPHEFLEHPDGVLVAGFGRVDRYQIVHGHDEPGAELPFQRQHAVQVILVHPGGAEQAQDRGRPIVENARPR